MQDNFLIWDIILVKFIKSFQNVISLGQDIINLDNGMTPIANKPLP